MNFTVSSSVIYNRLQAISRVISSKSIYPILDNFLFCIENGKLTVTAADSDTTLETVVELTECDKDGQVALPAKTLLDALKDKEGQRLLLRHMHMPPGGLYLHKNPLRHRPDDPFNIHTITCLNCSLASILTHHCRGGS